MKKIFILLLLILINFFYADGQHLMLWKISGDSLSKPSFIFGTMHMICGDELDLRPVSTAIQMSESIIMEVDLDQPGLNNTMQKLMIDPQMQAEYERLDNDDKAQINEFLLKNMGADLAKLGVLKPVAILSLAMFKNMPCANVTQVEQELVIMSKTYRIGIVGLETIEHQIDLMDQVYFEDQIDWILEVLSGDFQRDFEDLSEAYLKGDLDEMENIILESPGVSNYADLLIYERNYEWLEKLVTEIKKGSRFIAVGVGHLLGSNGLLELLKDEGYEVEVVE